MGYPKETMGYYFYYHVKNKIFVARNAEFFENSFIVQEVSGSNPLLEASGSTVDLNLLQKENTLPSGNTSIRHAEVEHMDIEPQHVDVPIRRSARTSQAPERYKFYVDAEEHELEDHGFTQTYRLEYEETFSPVADVRAIRILLAIAALYDYEIWQMDVKTTFLNGHLSKDQASNKSFDEEIKKIDFTQNPDEPCVYMNASGSNDLGEAAYILGIKITRDRSKRLLSLSQSAYFEKLLKKYRMDKSKCVFTPMQEKPNLNKSQGAVTPKEVKGMQIFPYASAIGSIMYAVRCTRPHVAFVQNLGSQFQQNSVFRRIRTTLNPKLGMCSCLMMERWTGRAQSKALSRCVVPSNKEPKEMLCDNSTAISIADDPGIMLGARHYQRRFHYIREVIEDGEIVLNKVRTDDNVADPFTKPMSLNKHYEHAMSIGVRSASSLM
ncbi:retrotransposon protein, putative, ty1-copia subclass [Tanacetum coccineum]